MKEEKRKSLKVQIWEELEARGWVTPLSEPPDSFCEWWKNHDHAPKRIEGKHGEWGWTSGITAFKAWQCANYRDEFKARGHENAMGTGICYAYFGWWRRYPQPVRSNPEFLKRYKAWCRQHNKPEPKTEDIIPQNVREAKSFDDTKAVLRDLSAKMDMNKAIGWTQADSDAANQEA
jgi:hypothetical protein